MSACELSGRHILAMEEDAAPFHVFLKEISIEPAVDIAQEDNQILSLQQHLGNVGSLTSHSKPSISGTSYGIASTAT